MKPILKSLDLNAVDCFDLVCVHRESPEIFAEFVPYFDLKNWQQILTVRELAQYFKLCPDKIRSSLNLKNIAFTNKNVVQYLPNEELTTVLSAFNETDWEELIKVSPQYYCYCTVALSPSTLLKVLQWYKDNENNSGMITTIRSIDISSLFKANPNFYSIFLSENYDSRNFFNLKKLNVYTLVELICKDTRYFELLVNLPLEKFSFSEWCEMLVFLPESMLTTDRMPAAYRERFCKLKSNINARTKNTFMNVFLNRPELFNCCENVYILANANVEKLVIKYPKLLGSEFGEKYLKTFPSRLKYSSTHETYANLLEAVILHLDYFTSANIGVKSNPYWIEYKKRVDEIVSNAFSVYDYDAASMFDSITNIEVLEYISNVDLPFKLDVVTWSGIAKIFKTLDSTHNTVRKIK